jgi:hypothetical protein
MTKSAAEVEREVEASRGELDRTMEALKDKMTPGQLFDEASRAMGGAGQQVLSKFMAQAKENPMPLAVMGLGLAWLMSSSNRKTYPPSDYYEPRSFRSKNETAGLGETVGEKLQAAGERASDVMSSAQDKLASATSAARDAGRDAAENLSAMASTAMHKAGDYREQAQRGIMDMLDREPVLIGGLAFVVGAAIGASLPSTTAEDQLVGSSRDKLIEKGKEALQDGMQTAGEVAQSAYHAVKSELENADGQTDLTKRVENATRAGVQAVRAEVPNELQ